MRVDFLVDGFNVYHSLKTAQRHLDGASTRWLDLRGLLSGFLHAMPFAASLGQIHYFSALATHLEANDRDMVARHRHYIDALEATGVTVHLGRFKEASRSPCSQCGHQDKRWEEKETDVAISVKLIELLHQGEAEAVCIVSGDTDLAPAMRTARRLFPAVPLVCMFPYLRKNKELGKLAAASIQLSRDAYTRHQLPDPAPGKRAKSVAKPTKW
jgi:uncharacterized LabA/DUF88 family protein